MIPSSVVEILPKKEMQKRSRRQWSSHLRVAALLLITFIFLLPFLYVLLVSLRSRLELLMSPLGLPQNPSLDNYRTVIGQMNYGRSLLNTIGISLATCLLISIITPLAAYPLARLSMRWTKAVYVLFSLGLVIPFFLIMIPLYTVVKSLGLMNTYTGVVLLYTTSNLPLGIFLYTSFIHTIPRELEEAAVIDGSTPLQTFRYIVLPLLRPVTATLLIFVVLSVWNDFLLPLLFLSNPESRTIMINVYSFVGQYGFDPTTLFPASVLASLPLLIFFFVLQRQIVAGITAGAVKG